MDFKNERLMMTEEEVRNRLKELLNENQADLLTKCMFLEQQCKKQNEVIEKAICYVQENTCWELRTSKLLDILKEVPE